MAPHYSDHDEPFTYDSDEPESDGLFEESDVDAPRVARWVDEDELEVVGKDDGDDNNEDEREDEEDEEDHIDERRKHNKSLTLVSTLVRCGRMYTHSSQQYLQNGQFADIQYV